MPEAVDHNRIIAEAARSALTPLGLRRKGRSRIWLDDHGWWLGIVEFQPSSWSRTTGLNVAAQFLWEESDHLRYDVMFPTTSRIVAKRLAFDPDQPEEFIAFAQVVAGRAAQSIAELRVAFGDDANLLQRLAQEGEGIRKAFALGILGDLTAARAILSDRAAALLADHRAQPEQGPHSEWMIDKASTLNGLVQACSNHQGIVSVVNAAIRRTRVALKLPELADSTWPSEAAVS